jgi:5-methylcytosine-specific restriction endonuclease McrA
MTTYFNIPFEEKDLAKQLGAKWDSQAKLWYSNDELIASVLEEQWEKVLPSKELILDQDCFIGEDRNFGGHELFVDLVPKSCWFTNVRSSIVPKQWQIISKFIRKRAHFECEICHSKENPSLNIYLDAHERWEYQESQHIQKLKRIIALCKPCHLFTHYGYARVSGQEKKAQKHYLSLYNVNYDQMMNQINNAYQIWMGRSSKKWVLDLSILKNSNIEIIQK